MRWARKTMIDSRPVAVFYLLDADEPSTIAQLDRVTVHTKALNDSLRTVTGNAMTCVGAKSSDYSATPQRQCLMAQSLPVEDDETPLELNDLLPRGTGSDRSRTIEIESGQELLMSSHRTLHLF